MRLVSPPLSLGLDAFFFRPDTGELACKCCPDAGVAANVHSKGQFTHLGQELLLSDLEPRCMIAGMTAESR